MTAQLALSLAGGRAEEAAEATGLVAANTGVPQMAADDPLPPGPYRMDMTKYMKGSGPAFTSAPPWVIHAANGQCVCGWIDSRACAVAIAAALNAQHPVRR